VTEKRLPPVRVTGHGISRNEREKIRKKGDEKRGMSARAAAR